MTTAQLMTEKEARAQLSIFLDQLWVTNPGHFSNPAGIIRKAVFRGFELGLSFDDAHVVARSHLRNHRARNKKWWTTNVARVAWERAERHE